MEFAYIQKTSLIDYPENVCSTIFTIGCNFKCPFCYNKSLVLPEEFPKNPLTKEQVLNTLKKRKKIINAVCITGGEPTIHNNLYEFMKNLKEEDFLIKLDTNGTNPELVEKLINDKLVDYIALDVKNAPQEYDRTVNSEVNIKNVLRTIEILKSKNIPYELRTTIIPSFHNLDLMEELCKWVGGGEKFTIQEFKRTDSLIDSSLINSTPFSKENLDLFKKIAEKYFKKVEIRS